MFSGAWNGTCPDALRDALVDTGYHLIDVARPLPHPNGRRLSCNLAAQSHAAANTDDALVIGIAGLPGFNADVLARQWAARASATILLHGTPANGWAAASVAAHIQSDPAPFIEQMRAAARHHSASSLIVPAVLGTTHDGALHARIQDAVGLGVGEALGVPPSLPGWRLHRALRAALANANVTIIEHKVVSSTHGDERVSRISLANGDVVHARAFVLATGKFAAGGIDANGAFSEPALGCPVWIDHLGEAFDEPEALILTDPDRTGDQPLLLAGVHSDDRQRPVNRNGDVVYANVFIAGTIRAGWSAGDYTAGNSAQDGWNAGLQAVSA